jgi:hypothetical protein
MRAGNHPTNGDGRITNFPLEFIPAEEFAIANSTIRERY